MVAPNQNFLVFFRLIYVDQDLQDFKKMKIIELEEKLHEINYKLIKFHFMNMNVNNHQ